MKMYGMRFPGGESAVVLAESAGSAYETLKSVFMKSGYSEFCATPNVTDVYPVTAITPLKGEAMVIRSIKL